MTDFNSTAGKVRIPLCCKRVVGSRSESERGSLEQEVVVEVLNLRRGLSPEMKALLREEEEGGGSLFHERDTDLFEVTLQIQRCILS